MKELNIYMTGSPGFKSAIISQLSREWIHGAQDIGQEVVRFTLPDNVTLEALKVSVGSKIIDEHNVQFFEKPPANNVPYTQVKFIPGQAIKMSLWVNSDSTLTGKSATVAHEEDK